MGRKKDFLLKKKGGSNRTIKYKWYLMQLNQFALRTLDPAIKSLEVFF